MSSIFRTFVFNDKIRQNKDIDLTISFQLTFENVRNGLTGDIADLPLTTSDGKIKEKLADNMNIEEFESYYIPVTGEVHAQPAKKDDVIYVNNIFLQKATPLT